MPRAAERLRAGAVVYAKDLAGVSRFYAEVAGLPVVERDSDYTLLQSEGFQLVLVQIPAAIAAGIEISVPPERREDTPLKLCLLVPDLAAARARAVALGGVLDPVEREWVFQGRRVCDGHDPEGNVFQLQAPAAMAADATPPFEIRRATAADEPALAQLLELYQYELSDIWEQELDAAGRYGYGLARFWAGGADQAFMVWVEGRPAGFALVDRASRTGAAAYWMDQFFLLRRFRRGGIGRALAVHVFAALPGPWEVGQMPGNPAARQFWRRVIEAHTGGRFEELELREPGRWQGSVQRFVS